LPHPETILFPYTTLFRSIQKKSGHDVLKVHDLAFGYDPEHLLFQHVNLDINRGERIALIGPNGIGKSTFLKILLGHIKQSSGHRSEEHTSELQSRFDLVC